MTANPNFIYAYDNESDQIIVIDAETGERVEQRNNRVLSILNYLNEKGAEVKLRKFALWCAREANSDIKPMQKKFLELAEQAISQKAQERDLQQLYTSSEGEAVATDTVGLRQGSEKAPGFLASRECINPNAYEGAKNAARFHCLWAEMQKDEQEQEQEQEEADYFEEIGPVAHTDIIERTEQKQVDYLLDLIGMDE